MKYKVLYEKGDKIIYLIISFVVILFFAIILSYQLGVTSGYKDGFHYGYENNPLKYNSSEIIDEIIFLLNNLKLVEEDQVNLEKIRKQLSQLEDEIKYFEKNFPKQKNLQS